MGRNLGSDTPDTGGIGGSEVRLASVPAEPRFEYQQSPWLVGNSSHQKSTPLGSTLPSGVRLITLS